MSNDINPSKLLLKRVRLSFPVIWTAKDYQGNKKYRYSATALIEKGSDTAKAVEKAIAMAAQDKFGKKADAKLAVLRPQGNRCCYQDGNTKEYEGYQGMMALTAHRNQEAGRPTILDKDKTALTEESGKPYAGCYVNMLVSIYCQDGQNEGIRAQLLGLQFVADGDAFSGASVASEDDFEDLGTSTEQDAAALV